MNFNKFIKFFLKFFILLALVLFSIVWGYENSDIVASVKDKLKRYKSVSLPEVSKNNNSFNVEANSYLINVEKILSFKGKSAFLLYESENKNFEINNIKIYLQDGFLITTELKKKFNLSKNFTREFHGGLKLVFFNESETFGLISLKKNNCFYAAIVNLNNGQEAFKTDCLPEVEEDKLIDFNGMGSSLVYEEEFIIFSLGTPTTDSDRIRILAQNKKSFFGKILKINKLDLKKNIINPEIFTIGHRNPQGMTKANNNIFSVEHGPKGGDELNKIIPGGNYGWPKVSHGTKYGYDDNAKSYLINHEDNGFISPLYSFVPSVGISSLNNCPEKLKKYYKKNCLIALSLNGNGLREGKSIIIFLLDNNFNRVDTVEKILINSNFALRHFLTNRYNQLYEDENGSIFISADDKGLYKLSFENFR